jgi:CRISPR-associated endonuclease/helicase Cas3
MPEEEFLKYSGFLFALHDIGKCHPLFQQKHKNLEIVETLCTMGKLQEGDQSVYRHETVSARVVQEFLRAANNNRQVVRIWSEVVGMHHQRSSTGPTPIDNRIREFWENLQNEIKEKLWKAFECKNPCRFNLGQPAVTVSFLLLGLLVLSDWIASVPEWFVHGHFGESIGEYIKISQHAAKTAVIKLGLTKTPSIGPCPNFNQTWPNIPPENIRPLQAACEAFFEKINSPGLLIIEAPMGEGKTETAIFAGMQWVIKCGFAGIYMALPTAATSNQMYDRMRDFLDIHNVQKNIRLLHGMAWLMDDDSPEKLPRENDNGFSAEWFRSSRKGLLAPWAVGTVDQAMIAALRVRFNALRLLGLSNKILVIDEVHAYDVYMTVILERLLQWCGFMDIPVILLSATLPSGRCRALMDAYSGHKHGYPEEQSAYPLLTYSTTGGTEIYQSVVDVYIKRKVALKLWRGGLVDWEEVAQKALDLVVNGGCLCIIVNTVRESQELYKKLKEQKKEDVKILLFHSRFTAGDRQRIEQLCLKYFDKRSQTSCPECRPKKAVLVATQVVEQSLDLDFDYMISAIAPIDLLLQRIGRLHRHSGRIRPTAFVEPQLLVLLPEADDFGPTGTIYDPWVLYKTLDIIEKKEYIDIPSDLRGMVESVYNNTEPHKSHPYRHAWEELSRKRREHEREARQYLIPAPSSGSHIREEHWYEDDEGSNEWFRVHTRLGQDTVQVLLLEQDELQGIIDKMKSLTRAEARHCLLNLAALPGWWLKSLEPTGGFSAPIYGEGWLKGFRLLGIQDGRFIGYGKNNDELHLVDDPELGIYLERM